MTTQAAKDSDSVSNFLLGKSIDEARELYQQSSPRFHLDKNDSPTLILHGMIDQIAPIAQADGLAAHLKGLKIPHSYGRLDGWPHTMDLAKPVNDYCLAMMDRFFSPNTSRCLKRKIYPRSLQNAFYPLNLRSFE